MAAGYQELFVEQGAYYSTSITLDESNGDAFDLTGYDVKSQMRKSYYSSTAYDFTATVTGVANGEITISMTAANTANISAGRYLYDLVITSPASVKTRVVEGIVVVMPGVTQ